VAAALVAVASCRPDPGGGCGREYRVRGRRPRCTPRRCRRPYRVAARVGPWFRCATPWSASGVWNQTRVILLAVGLGSFFVLGVRTLQANLIAEFDVGADRNGADMFLIASSATRSKACAHYCGNARTRMRRPRAWCRCCVPA